ncbi:MAG: GNAT family N-acetyltransferase [Acidobacteria bacterium]|nr:GNAT family N-acetyltransferase [Acidobacteriota bacterium]NIM61895.1 GNAT family N-acetyltransferase [Acidobacteriota bacterium]NIO60389.1 GNAT family N-acetyltransferase [Acidobacteriota bacterium]NIQ31461.1 GNAT family N-acetyltransferase [Acidobacteriota bacterium]NIQ86705.1 GNAT family N-acetyltransferase [Acidobacteriota bacterium]
MSAPSIRHGQASDLDAISRIYDHYVATTHVTFDLEPPGAERRRAWFEQFSTAGRFQLYVASGGGEVLGFACSTPFKERAAYDISVETTVYLDPDAVARGLGQRLMATLVEALERAGVHRAYAGVALPNDASEALHGKLGFRRVGVLSEVGRKFDRYWDVAWYEKRLGAS